MASKTLPSEGTATQTTDPVLRAVLVATRRLRLRRTLRFGATGFLAGSAAGLIIAVALSTNLLRETTLPGGGAFLILPPLAGLLAGAFAGVAGKYEAVSVARLLERRLDLKDRLSTALATKRGGTPVEEAQYADAMAHAPGDAGVSSAVPLKPLPRRAYVAGALALAMLLAYFAPELPVFWSVEQRSERAAVRKEGERILALAKSVAAEAKKQNLPEAQKAAEKVEALGKEMARGRMPLRKALMERAKLGEELNKSQDKIASERAEQADKQLRTKLANTGRTATTNLKNSGVPPDTNAPANTPDDRMTGLQNALARGDRPGVAQKLREMADAAERGVPAPGGERDKAARQLQALGGAMNQNDLADAGKAIEKAGGSMRQNAMPEAAQSLREAASKIEQAGGGDPRQNPGAPPSGTGQAPSGGQTDQNAVQKMMNDLQKGSPNSAPQSDGLNSQQQQRQGQSPSSGSEQNSAPQQGSGQQSKPGALGVPSQAGQRPGAQQGNRPGESASSSAGAVKSGSAENKPGAGSRPGSGQGKSSAPKAGKSGGGKGAGEGSSGAAKTGVASQRLSKGAREQNIRGKQSGAGPETVIIENDTDRSALPVASLPYYKEFVKERGGPASESVQTREAVPNAYRNQVRGYFDALPTAPRSGAKGQ